MQSRFAGPEKHLWLPRDNKSFLEVSISCQYAFLSASTRNNDLILDGADALFDWLLYASLHVFYTEINPVDDLPSNCLPPQTMLALPIC